MGKQLHWRYKQRLKPFADHYLAMFLRLGAMSTEELEKLLVSCDAVSSSSRVGWITYEAARAIRDDVRSHIRQRKQAQQAGDGAEDE